MRDYPPGSNPDSLFFLWSENPLVFVVMVGMFLVGLALYVAERNKSAEDSRYGFLAWALMCFSCVPFALIVLTPLATLVIGAWVVEWIRQLLGGFGVFILVALIGYGTLVFLGSRRK